MSGFIYLASPYWAEEESVRLQRVYLARRATAELLAAGFILYSPICHGHEIAKDLPATLRNSHKFWMSIDLPILAQADALWVLCLDGWEASRGIQAEVHHAQDLSIPITYLPPKDLDAYTADRPNSDLRATPEENLRAVGPAGTRRVD